MRRAILAGVVCVFLALTALPASAGGAPTVYRSKELRITESLTGGATTWTFRNRTNQAEGVSCRWGISVILSDGDTVQDHIHWSTSLLQTGTARGPCASAMASSASGRSAGGARFN